MPRWPQSDGQDMYPPGTALQTFLQPRRFVGGVPSCGPSSQNQAVSGVGLKSSRLGPIFSLWRSSFHLFLDLLLRCWYHLAAHLRLSQRSFHASLDGSTDCKTFAKDELFPFNKLHPERKETLTWKPWPERARRHPYASQIENGWCHSKRSEKVGVRQPIGGKNERQFANEGASGRPKTKLSSN